MILDTGLVLAIHNFILANEPGVAGENVGALEGAIGRIETHRQYETLDDVFEIAGFRGFVC
jgi:death-on-curing protein